MLKTRCGALWDGPEAPRVLHAFLTEHAASQALSLASHFFLSALNTPFRNRDSVRLNGVYISLPNLQLCLYESMPDGSTLFFLCFFVLAELPLVCGGTEG